MQPWKDPEIKDVSFYRIPDMASCSLYHHTHWHLSSMLVLTRSLSPQPPVPVTELRAACLSGPAGRSVSVHGAGDNDFQPLPPPPPPPPHPKLQWWRWLQLDDVFLPKLQGICWWRVGSSVFVSVWVQVGVLLCSINRGGSRNTPLMMNAEL